MRRGPAWLMGVLIVGMGILLGPAGGPAYAACTNEPLPEVVADIAGPKWLSDCYAPAKELLEPEAYAAYLEDARKGACESADRRLFKSFRARYPKLPFAEDRSDRRMQWGRVMGDNYLELDFCYANRALERAEANIRAKKIKAPPYPGIDKVSRQYDEGGVPEEVFSRNVELTNMLWQARGDFGPAQIVVVRYGLNGVFSLMPGAPYYLLLRAQRQGEESPDFERLLKQAKVDLKPELRTFVEANIETPPPEMFIKLKPFDKKPER